ncbi:MAG: hypothetical protein DRN08_04655 [Thermoplasmata archaeon]|nr:MAG: hypothetical protein DRN08_04655 [Thermoplasmata archaeon]
MDELNFLIHNIKKYRNIVIQRRLRSKKNMVYHAFIDNKPVVLKWYTPGRSKQMKIEQNILKNGSSSLHIPVLLDKDTDNNVLIMSYIPGRNLCDVINNNNISLREKKRILILLANWFAVFHDYFKTPKRLYVRGDSILNNFIINTHVWGVDFEEFRKGNPMEDIADMCSSILSTNPMFTYEKFQLCKTFITSYPGSAEWDSKDVDKEIANMLIDRIQWRPWDEKILIKYANRIRKEGL